jgi:catechol 2,3-dioxygenase-like lactoylglutathione lyase family enzyme
VQAFHDAAVNHGGVSIEEPPGLRDSAMGPMHLAYVRDPDGNKLCAVYRQAA